MGTVVEALFSLRQQFRTATLCITVKKQFPIRLLLVFILANGFITLDAAPPQTKEETAPATPAWPRPPEMRKDFDFNQGWRFFLPPAKTTSPAYAPPASARVKEGSFPQSTQPQDVTIGSHISRYVCLEALSSQNGGPFASVAEFNLLDVEGKPLPRAGWSVAYVDSEEAGSDDLAGNAIDGNPDTKWHSKWMSAEPGPPHYLVIDTGRPTQFSGFRVLPRQDGNPSGMIKDWRFYVFDQAPPNVRHEAVGEDVAKLDDAGWETVNLPHTVRLEPLNASGGQNYQGVCWYRKHFTLNNSWKDHKICLLFEGAMATADVWLNGVHLASHYCGYLPFTVDLSKQARFDGENIVTVKLDNSNNPEVPPGKSQDTLDFTYFGGLYRGVHLQIMDPLHVTDPILANKPAGGGVFVTFPEVSATAATVRIQTDVTNESGTPRDCKVSQTLTAPDGTVTASAETSLRLEGGASHPFAQTLEVKQPALWHPNHPSLYVLHTVVSIGNAPGDDVFTRVGIRRIQFDKDKGLFINGEHFISIGANRHQDHPYVGYALSPEAHYRDAKKLRDAGMTSFRSHYPQDPAFMDACDELGILAIVSNPGWQFMGGDLFKQRVLQDARDMARYYRNYPSVILWEAQLNEIDNRPIAIQLQNIIHEECPGDQCFTAGDRVRTLAGFNGWDVEYSGNNGSKPDWVREWGDQVDNWTDQQSSSRVPRGWGETPLLVQAWSHLSRLDGIFAIADGPDGPGTGRLCGACLWAGVDCYRGYHHQPFYGGFLDLFRLPMFDYYMFQSQRPADIRVPGVDSGPMVFIANDATYQSPTAVTVFSNCEEVRLSQNGKVLATQKPDPDHKVPHPPFTFRIGQFEEHSMLYSTGVARPGTEVGQLKAEGLIHGEVAATQTIRSPGVPTHLELQADTTGHDLTADGSDFVRVYARLCDARGTTYPNGNDLVTFTVQGPGTIINDARIRANPINAEAGIATALVRAGTTPGAITVRAEAFGLKAATAVIESKLYTWPKL
jgi:beta-galactosidase